MSAETSGDVSLINDEDLLRKMWQDTEDFGRKKEIRAHMYKLREARLRDFYNSGEVTSEIKKTTSKTTESKSCSGSTHADSLADHSFISMKTKEIRDSESPTRDVSYRLTTADKGLGHGWTVVSSNQKSDDGKTFTTTKTATTSGTEKIDGGKIDYAAKNEQQASVYKDGDDKNFTKAVGASSNTFIKQEASGGDENSSFKSTSTKASSSSKYVSEHRSTSGDVIESQVVPSKMITQNQDDQFLVSRKTYTDNIPNELKNHPSYVDGKTKVIRETRTLPDGTTVTTTKYEIRGGTTTQSSKSSTTQQKSSSMTSQATESRTSQNESKTTRYIADHQPSSTTTTVTRHIYDELQPATTTNVTRTSKDHRLNSADDRTTKTIIVYDSRNEPRDDLTTTTKTTTVRKIYDSKEVPSSTTDSNVTHKTTVVKNIYDVRKEPQIVDDSDTTATIRTTVIKNIYDAKDQSRAIDDSKASTITKTTVTKQINDSRDARRQTEDYTSTKINRQEENERFITVEQQDNRKRLEPTTESPDRCPNESSKPTPQEKYDSPDRQPKPQESYQSPDKRPKPQDQYESPDRRPKPQDQYESPDRRPKEQYESPDRRPQPQKQYESPDKRPQPQDQYGSPDRRPKDQCESPDKRPQPQDQYASPHRRPKPQEVLEKRPKPQDQHESPKPQEKYDTPEPRQPIKPGKSEFDDKPRPTEGQYETTYRTDYTNKRISVDVSPTHEAFARSLRAVSPDRISKCSSPSRSLRTSTNSLRSSTSPEKNRHPSRSSPDRRSTSPKKATSHEIITHRTKITKDATTKKTNKTEIDSSTLTRRKNRPKSRSPSPTSIASDIEFIRNTDIITDLDTNETVITQSRPSTLEVTRKTTRKITDRSPTSPLTDSASPKKPSPKDAPRRGSLRNISPSKEPSDKPFKRTDTYEERCRQILGITTETDKRKNSLERVTKKGSYPKATPDQRSPTKETPSPTRKSPEKKIQEFPSQTRRSPEKEPLQRYPEKKSPVKEAPKISEFPSQIKKSPEKEPTEKYPQRKIPAKDAPKIGELTSQIKKSPEKHPQEKYPERKSPVKEAPKIAEFPSQIRRTTEKEPLENYPEKRSPVKEAPKIGEFPSQIRRTMEKEPLENYPEKRSPVKEAPKIGEFPSQIKRTPEKEPLDYYPEKKSPVKEAPKIAEFPSQIRRTTEKEPLENYPEKKSPVKEAPKIAEFPSQIRRTPEREPLEDYPERKSPLKEAPKIGEFPSQIRRTPEREPLEDYPERKSPVKEPSKISEFPSQARKSPEKQPSGKYPTICEPTEKYPSQETYEREPSEVYPSKISEFPSQVIRSPDKKPSGERTLPEKEPLEEYPQKYPERASPSKEGPKISEFPSQIPKIQDGEPSHRYPDRAKPSTEPSDTNKFPSYEHPETTSDIEEPVICEFPPQTTKPEKQPIYRGVPQQRPQVDEPPSHTRKSPVKEPSKKYPEKEQTPVQARKQPTEKDRPKINEFPSQIKRAPEKEPLEKYPEKTKPQKEKDGPKIGEFPSQIRKSPEKARPTKEAPKVSEYSSPTKKIPDRSKPRTDEVRRPTKDNEKPDKTEYQSRIFPTSPSKPKKDRQRTTSTSSSTTDEEQDVEEINTVRRVTEVEGKVPVDEPIVTKKFIDQLCRDDEIQRSEVTRKNTQNLLTKEMLETGVRTTNKTVKKDAPKKPQDAFIDNERADTTITITKYSSPRATSPTKKPQIEKNNVNTNKRTTTTTTTIKSDVKTKKITDDKPKPKDTRKTTEKITLYNVENLNESKEDTRVHIRTHRIDDTINKKVTKTIINGDSTKKAPIKRPIKPEEPKTKRPAEKKPQKLTSKTVTEIETRRTTTVPKRHVVTTTIAVSPKTRLSKTPTRPVTSKPTTKTTKITKKPKLQNGHVTSDDESIVDSLDGEVTEEISTTRQREKITRTSTEVTKKKPEKKIPIRATSKPEVLAKTKQEKKCITTKSIIINNEATEREVIVDLQRSKSSREPTPDRICPLPVSSDDESTPRYPDRIAEPDDDSLRRKSKKLSDIPILESEDVREFSRITEIEDTTKVDRVEETDESLLSVNKKIHKFLDTTDKVTKTKQSPAPKVERPRIEVNEDLESDECLLSVSQKVNKFITTAEQLTAPQDLPQRPKSPKCQYYPEDDVSVSDKVAHFITTAEKIVTAQKGPAPKIERPNIETVDERIKEDECLLSVSDKVSKFINTAVKLTTDTKKTVSLAKIEPDDHTRRSKETTPTRKPSNQYTSIKTEDKPTRRESSPKLPDSTPKSTRRPSEDEPKSVLSPIGRLRSTESIKKAKALFENIGKEQQVVKQRDILSRPSVFEGRKITETARKLEYESEEEEKNLKSTRLVIDKGRPRSPEKVGRRSQSPEGDVPGYMKPLDRKSEVDRGRPRPKSPERVHDGSSRRSQSPESDVPGYMRPLDRKSVVDRGHPKPKSPERLNDGSSRRSQSPESDVPGYMRPLDRKSVPDRGRPTRKSPERLHDGSSRRSQSPESDIPGYMRPLDRKSVVDREHPKPKSPERFHDGSSRRSQSPESDIPGYMRPLDRQSGAHRPHHRPQSPEKVHDFSSRRSQTPDSDIPGYMRPLDRRSVVDKARSRPKSPEKVQETLSRRSQTPDSDVPGYMRPLDRSLRPNSPHRDNVTQTNRRYSTVKTEDSTDVRETKFGVTLRRTDSGRAITTTKSQVVVEEITESEIEEIYDIEILEQLLEKVVSYELRRKIRTQIRLVKKLISEGKLIEVTTKKTAPREKTPVKTTKQSRETVQKTTEYQSSYAYNERRSSSEYTKVTRRSQSPETKPSRGKTPEKSPTRTTKVFETQLKKTSPSSKPVVDDAAPEWVRQRNLKKHTDTVTTRASSSTTTTTSKKSRSSPVKETKPTDIITSSYGVGPTDENGSPLFGLKALRARNKTDTTKVQGTVIRSQYYSENGEEPVGEISVTNYSSDPRDLGRDDEPKSKGITSVTTTQKFGYKDTPSLKNLTKKKKEICETVEDEAISKTTKVSRRGSVKALSQKFIENAVETSKSERQSSYPKAGLILRTSSFKESASSGDSREGSTERTVTTKTSSTRTVAGETFLSNRTKVTGVQDVIGRMKTEEVREGDSVEDVEARGLLNKFIGAQVILSGIESNVRSSSSTVTGSDAKRTTKVTTTITEGGKPTTKTRIFHHPLTDEELESVWDEQTLRLLLEQSTDYEERRIIRARLRQVMAEQEACTELVDKASQDHIGTTFEGVTKKSFTEEPVATSQVTTRVTSQQVSKKPMSPFAKFRQLDKQNSLNTPPRTSN